MVNREREARQAEHKAAVADGLLAIVRMRLFFKAERVTVNHGPDCPGIDSSVSGSKRNNHSAVRNRDARRFDKKADL